MKQVFIKGSKRAITRCADRDAVIDAWSQTGAGLVTDSHVTTTVHVVTERVITDGCVTGSPMCCFPSQDHRTHYFRWPYWLQSALRPCALLKAPSTLLKSAFVPKALLSEPSALWTSALAPTAVFSVPVVLRNSAPAANCGVIIRLVESQRSGANSGVGVAGGSRKQRIPANSRVCRTGGEGRLAHCTLPLW